MRCFYRTNVNRRAVRELIIITKNLPMQYTEIFLALKIENFQLKKIDIFLNFAQNIDCGYTLEPPRYPQSMFWSKNKKNRYTPAYPSFTIQKWGMRGYTLHGHVFPM